MHKIKVLQQYANTGEIGGLKTEYQALIEKNGLSDRYEFVPMILKDCHCGISIRDIRFYYKVIRQESPDIVQIRGAGIESLNAVLAARMASIGKQGKILTTVHGMFSELVYYSTFKRLICRYIIEPLIFGLSDGISCVCERTAGQKRFRRYRKKMLPCIYNRIPKLSYPSDEEKKRIRNELGLSEDDVIGIYVGRITKEKGLSYFSVALKNMDEKWPDGLLIMIVGDGEYHTEIQNECLELKHSDRIVFCGQQKDVRKYLDASDFFILPSLHENLSIAILEACSAGLPCIVTDVGGNSEIIRDDVNGFVISPSSEDDIEKSLLKMCDKEKRTELTGNTRNYDHSSFSDKNVDRQMVIVYEKLLNQSRKTRGKRCGITNSK